MVPKARSRPESTGKKWVKSIPLNIHRSSRDFCSVWAFTHWVKMRNRVRARGYWSKPHFSLPYPWIWVINLSGHRIQTADGTPLLIVARALGYRHLSAPGGGDLRPALIPKLVQKQCDHRLGVPGRVTQTALQPLDLAVVVGVWTKQAHARRLQGQTTQLQHAPHPTQ